MKIGFTSTIPVEAVFAGGHSPVDLNNLFVSSGQSPALVARAKMDGFPDTTCSWICGLYATALDAEIDALVGVTGGDCSETLALMEVLAAKGIRVIPFGYPHQPDKKTLRRSITALAEELGTTIAACDAWKTKLDESRSLVMDADRLLWQEGKGNGEDLRFLELSCTDFEGDADIFNRKVSVKLAEISASEPKGEILRIGVCGVPPIISDFYQVIESKGCRIVFSEVERQFSIPYPGAIEDAYSRYTYPYGMTIRAADINAEAEKRSLDGIIHYVQSFCFRGIEDIVLRQKCSLPVLTLQGDLPSRVTGTMEIRIEAFIDMLLRRKGRA